MAGEIYIPTDAELKQMEEDPNYVGKGVIRHEVRGHFKKMELICVYHGDATNILNGGNHHRHAIKIKNKTNRMSTVVPYWSAQVQVIRTDKQLMIAFLLILRASIEGAMTPESYCDLTGKNGDAKRTEVTYFMCKRTYEQTVRVFGKGKKGVMKMMKYRDALVKAGVAS